MELSFVQFNHPGNENTSIEWNNSIKHKRRFLLNKSQYIHNNKIVNSEKGITFWCEWEAQIKNKKQLNQKINSKKIRELPRILGIPYYNLNIPTKGLLNTDPFIFGDHFYYGFCKQDNNKKLKKLSNGSLILFGSSYKQKNGKISNNITDENDFKFVIDTVFIIKKSIDFTMETYNNIEKEIGKNNFKFYNDLTLKMADCSNSDNFRFYIGAMYNDMYENMYSFFPCSPYDENKYHGFERPEISIDLKTIFGNKYEIIFKNKKDTKSNLINQNAFRNQCVIAINKLEYVREIWKEVIKQVELNNLFQGIFTEIPKELPADL